MKLNYFTINLFLKLGVPDVVILNQKEIRRNNEILVPNSYNKVDRERHSAQSYNHVHVDKVSRVVQESDKVYIFRLKNLQKTNNNNPPERPLFFNQRTT